MKQMSNFNSIPKFDTNNDRELCSHCVLEKRAIDKKLNSNAMVSVEQKMNELRTM